MAAAECGVLRRNAGLAEWASFFLQVLIAISFEVGDDLGRGLFSQHGTTQGITDAHEVVSAEMAHGLWVEPGWQLLFLQTRHLFGLTVGWLAVVHAMNGIYVFCHVFVTLGVAMWVYFYRRRAFVVLRNIVMLTNAISLAVYESFPVAPPRLTSGLTWNGHPFTFQDTVFGVLSGGRMVSQKLVYNEFSAMPSVHIAWALIVAGALLWLARPLGWKIAAVVYPFVMLAAVVVTGNHYILDGVAAIPVVALAVIISFGAARLPWAGQWPNWVREYVVGQG